MLDTLLSTALYFPQFNRRRRRATNSERANMNAANEIHPRHFEMLRLAKLRGLKVRKIGGEVYAVTSFTRPGFEWAVSAGVCSCPSLRYCTHLAAVVDRYFLDDAPTADFMAYRRLDIDDRYQLRLRIRSGETTRNDRIYLRYCMKVYEQKREAVKAPAITKTVIKEGRRTRTVEKCGAFTI